MTSRIVLVGEAWGREEAEAQAPFVGSSGRVLDGMLRQVGIRRDECFVTNVLNFQPKGRYKDNDLKNVCGPKAEAIVGYPAISSGKYLRAEFQSELSRLYTEIFNEGPTLIVALGATAAWALLGTTGIKKIRGAPSVLTGPAFAKIGSPIKVFPTYHPAAVMRDWGGLRPTVISDLAKAKHEATFPELRRPRREIWIEPTLSDLANFERDFIIPSRDLSVDIETAAEQITCIGFSPSIDRSIVVPFVRRGPGTGSYWSTLEDELAALAVVRRWCAMTLSDDLKRRVGFPNLVGLPRKRGIGQNHLYDINYLWTRYGIMLACDEDTMLLHHALQPELEKGLGYLASIYTDELPWKFMREKHETLKKED